MITQSWINHVHNCFSGALVHNNHLDRLQDEQTSARSAHQIWEDLRVFWQPPPSLPPSVASREPPNPAGRRSSCRARVDPRGVALIWSGGPAPRTSGQWRCIRSGGWGEQIGGGRSTRWCLKEPWWRENGVITSE